MMNLKQDELIKKQKAISVCPKDSGQTNCGVPGHIREGPQISWYATKGTKECVMSLPTEACSCFATSKK